MSGYESLRKNFGPWSEGCTVADLIWLIGAAAQELSNRGLGYADEVKIAQAHVAELWKADRGARAVEQFKGRTSEVGEA